MTTADKKNILYKEKIHYSNPLIILCVYISVGTIVNDSQYHSRLLTPLILNHETYNNWTNKASSLYIHIYQWNILAGILK